MKLFTLDALIDHFSGSIPNNLLAGYIISLSDLEERNFVLQRFLDTLSRKKIEFDVLRFSEDGLEKLLSELASFSMMGNRRVLVLEGADTYSVKKLQPCLGLLQGSLDTTVFFLGKMNKSLASFYEKGNELLGCFDIPKEKPWDQKTRVIKWLSLFLHAANKRCSCIDYLLDRVGTSFATLTHEIEKLICYVGEKTDITQNDINAVCSPSTVINQWQFADKVIFGRLNSIDVSIAVVEDFHFYLSLFRKQLQLGLQMSIATPEQVATSFPKLYPKKREQLASLSKRLGAPYFQKGLNELFETETLSKSTSVDLKHLLEMFILKLEKEKMAL